MFSWFSENTLVVYIQNFAAISEPLHELRRRNVPFVWGVWQQETFDKLKAGSA